MSYAIILLRHLRYLHQKKSIMQKNYFKRYVWLLDLLQVYGRLTLNEIQEKWKNCTLCLDKKDIAPRTFQNMKTGIEEMFGIHIGCGANYEYYIDEDCTASGIKKWMLDAISLNNILGESCDLKDKVLFEEVPSSRANLEVVLHALRDKLVIEMDYQGGKMTEPRRMSIEPWCLKIFKQRWYLIGWSLYSENPGIRTYMLERANNVTITDRPIGHMPADFDGTDYLRSYYGVHQAYGEPHKETIEIKVLARQRPFLRELPLHDSQVEVETTDDYSVFRYCLVWNFDFRQELLSWGSQVEVLKPDNRRKEMEEELKSALKKYISEK